MPTRVYCSELQVFEKESFTCFINSLILQQHSALTVCAIIIMLSLIVVVSFRTTEYKANLYVNKCWDDFTKLNKTVDMMALQIRVYQYLRSIISLYHIYLLVQVLRSKWY